MDKDRVAGVGHQVAGSLKEAIGKVTGDTQLEAEGTAQKAAATAENAKGGANDAVRSVLKK